MFKFLDIFRKPKKIAFIDGDQNIPQMLKAYTKYVANTGTETHFIKLKEENHNEPKVLKKYQDMNKIFLSGMTSGKEVVDKFIGAYIQRAVSEGYKEITVISCDYDFIDIFKMAVRVDPNASKVTFRMIIPKAQGRACELPSQLLNIEIIK